MATLAFYVGGGDFSGQLKMPILNVEFHNTLGLRALYIFTFVYLFLRYWLVFKTVPYISEGDRNEFTFQKTKNFESAAYSVFYKYANKNKRLCCRFKWKTKENNELHSFKSIWSDNLADEEFNPARLKVDSTNSVNKKDDTTAMLLYTGIDGRELISESFKPFGRKNCAPMLGYVLQNILRDKYILDWYFPFMLATVPSAFIVYELFTQIYLAILSC
jgi:hypothetical protein